MTEYAIYDKAELLDRVGEDEELVQELIELFLEDYPNKITGIEEGLKNADADLVHTSAHGLKGSCGNLSFNSVAEYAKQIESAGKEGNFKEAANSFELLKSELEKLLSIIA